jgi:hypothetical protein
MCPTERSVQNPCDIVIPFSFKRPESGFNLLAGFLSSILRLVEVYIYEKTTDLLVRDCFKRYMSFRFTW